VTLMLFALQDAPSLGFESGWRSLAALAIVFGLLGGLAWLARRGTLPGGFGKRTVSSMRVEGALPLGERRSLVVVEVEGRRLVIGLSPASVSLITELPAPRFDTSLQSAVDRRDEARR